MVAGAQVELFLSVGDSGVAPPDSKPLASTRSDAEGRFTLAGLPLAMRFAVRLAAPGFATVWRTLSLPLALDGEHILWMDPQTIVFGQITRGPAREPVALVEIQCNLTAREEALTAVSDEYGEFELFTTLGFLRLTLRAPGELPVVHQVIARDRHVLDIQLGPRRVVSGEVVDLVAGLPMAGASIGGHVTTDRAGQFEFRTSALEGCTVEVTAPGYATATANLSVMASGRQRIALLREASVAGTVRDSAGRPVGGASVVLSLWQQALRERDQLSVAAMYGKCGKVTPPPTGASKVQEPAFHGPVRTDAEGRFHFAGVGAGAGLVVCRAVACCVGFADAESTLLEVPFPGGSAAVDLVLHRATTVHGMVRLQGVPTRARVQIDTASGLRLETGSDLSGRYVLAGIPAGAALVEVTVASLAPVRQQQPLTVHEGATQVLDFDLAPHASTIRGQVVYRGASPHTGLASATQEPVDGKSQRYHARVDRLGGFAIPVPDDPTLRFTLSFGLFDGRAQGGRPGVRAGEDVGVLQATRLCAVYLQLLDATTRAPLAVGRCFYRPHDTDVWQEVTGSSAPGRNPHAPDQLWLPWGLLDLRIEPASPAHTPVEHSGLTVDEHGPRLTLLAPRR